MSSPVIAITMDKRLNKLRINKLQCGWQNRTKPTALPLTAGADNMTHFTHYHSPLGDMTLQANEHGLLGAWFDTQTTQPNALGQAAPNHPILLEAISQLESYFAGTRSTFTLPIAATGTAFQQTVWRALCTIPYGQTWSYQQLAHAIGNPKAVRAVGLANGKNPISIIVPCHRVIGKSGKMTGYAGGLERKVKLLALEQAGAL